MLSLDRGRVVITGGGGLLGKGLALCRPAPPIARRGASAVIADVTDRARVRAFDAAERTSSALRPRTAGSRS